MLIQVNISFIGSSCSCSTMKSPIETFLKESGEMVSEVFVTMPAIRQNTFNCELATDGTAPTRYAFPKR